ncbi:MAG: hypothetical protein M1825_004413 [Sarcosagium campestre]|nr:MAG: hypothetical protein M1825_004413 [Sarcosagium campestre]
MCFIASAALLQVGIGLDTVSRCRIAIDLCLVFYVGGKVILYMFLVERAHAIRASRYKRYRDIVWISSTAIVLLGFGTIAVFAFLKPVSEISKTDGKCRIGVPLEVSLPLLTYDILINLGMTMLFLVLVYPHMRHGVPAFVPPWLSRAHAQFRRKFLKGNDAFRPELPLDQGGTIQRLAWKSFAASIAILFSTVANLSVLLYIRGREQGWLCFTMCTIDSESWHFDSIVDLHSRTPCSHHSTM